MHINRPFFKIDPNSGLIYDKGFRKIKSNAYKSFFSLPK